jgi:tRNA A37 threonylcarbamoyladenosine dehydratase
MRRELRSRGIKELTVVYSKEEAIEPKESVFLPNGKKTVGSISFVPGTAGLLIASKVCEFLLEN